MSTEVAVAVIAAAGVVLAGGAGTVTAYLTARHQACTQARELESEFIADRDKLLWEQAGKFWDERAQELVKDVLLERKARESETASLKADIALLKQDSVKLSQAHMECQETILRLEARLVRAGETLLAEVKAEVEAQVEAQEH